jgi:hypothetical protein
MKRERKIFGRTAYKVSKQFRMLHNEKLRCLQRLRGVVRVMEIKKAVMGRTSCLDTDRKFLQNVI